MKQRWKHKTVWLAAAAVVLAGTASIQGAMAYFTTYVTARGGYPVTLGTNTEIQEDVRDMTKHITISNTGETECYVRVKVFSGDQIEIQYSGAVAENGDQFWTLDSDGYWYYRDIVPVGEATEELLAEIVIPDEYKDSFNVVVVQECTAVLYDDNNEPYSDWSRVADTKTDIGTPTGEGDE